MKGTGVVEAKTVLVVGGPGKKEAGGGTGGLAAVGAAGRKKGAGWLRTGWKLAKVFGTPTGMGWIGAAILPDSSEKEHYYRLLEIEFVRSFFYNMTEINLLGLLPFPKN